MTTKEEIQVLRKEIELLRKEVELIRLTQPVFIPQPYPVNPWPINPYPTFSDHGGMCACPMCLPTITFTTCDSTTIGS